MSSNMIERSIQTERLLLRCPEPGDGEAVYGAVVESLPSLRAWPASLPWALHEPSIEASAQYCVQSAREFDSKEGFVFLAFGRDGALVGSIGLHHVDWALPKMEIGFWLRSAKQRQGYAREAVGAVVDFALHRLGARRVEARTDEDNRACRATCLAAGLRLEGILRHERITPGGQLKNTCVYASTGRATSSPACCEARPGEVLSYPAIHDMLADLLEPIHSFDFGDKAASWNRCRRCGQRWLYAKACVGHRDWDHHLSKHDAPDAFFELSRSSLPG